MEAVGDLAAAVSLADALTGDTAGTLVAPGLPVDEVVRLALGFVDARLTMG
jgi:hypothetical protein